MYNAPIHYIEVYMLTPSIYDPYSKEPSYKHTSRGFEKTGGGSRCMNQNRQKKMFIGCLTCGYSCVVSHEGSDAEIEL